MTEYYEKLKLLEPEFWSSLSETIFNVEKLWLRWDSVLFAKLKKTTIPESVFRSLQSLFKTVESVSSARIEWNHTTISQYVANRSNWIQKTWDEWNKEIENISNAIDYIHEAFEWVDNPRDFQIKKHLLSELHYILMEWLWVWNWKEWADTPGSFRQINVKITRSEHTPPDYTQVPSYMDELLDFINNNDNQLYDLMKIALVHHRFVWIHPYENWNWRMVRCLTYSLLIKYWFDKDWVSLLNPSSLFCLNREKYYRYLSEADRGDEGKLTQWCEYAISWIYDEILHIEKFLDPDFVSWILSNALEQLYKEWEIDLDQKKILEYLYQNWIVSSKDVAWLVKVNDTGRSRKITNLKDLWLIKPLEGKQYIYVPTFEWNAKFFMYLYHILIKEWFTNMAWLDTIEWIEHMK